MIYDIRNPEKAKETLSNMTGLSERQWDQLIKLRGNFRYSEDFVQHIVEKYELSLPDFVDFQFVFFHITTSSNDCRTIREYGLYNLQETYKFEATELRQFLDSLDIKIDIENAVLKHKGQTYNIAFDNGEVDSDAWAVGRKFYFDFCICGFLSVSNNYEYGGYVHKRPEFLMNIDDLLNTNYIELWIENKKVYQVIVCVNSNAFVLDDESDEERVMRYLHLAYLTAYDFLQQFHG